MLRILYENGLSLNHLQELDAKETIFEEGTDIGKTERRKEYKNKYM